MGLIERLFREPRWGVHPDDHKRPAADAPLRVLPRPARVHLPLQQHVGGAARPVVLVGQKVLKGQLLAQSQGNISAPIHAPVSGTVTAIGEVTAPHPSGLGLAAITVEADGADRAQAYRDSYELVDQWTQKYFDTEDKQVAAFAAQLKALQTVEFNPYIPDLTSLNRAFNDFMTQRHPIRAVRRTPATSTVVP